MIHPDPILRRVHACVLARVPVILWSAPGTGKTARVLAYGRARGLHVERWLLSRCEPIDIKPRVYHEGRVVVTSAPEVERLHANGGVLFADELNRATREVEGAALDLIDNPPPGVAVIAACNPPSRGQAARSLESAAANRFCHLDVEVDAAAWANAQLNGWPEDVTSFPIPQDAALEKARARVAALVSAFIRARGDRVLEAPPTDPVNAGKPWPSARTWEYVARIHAVALALDLDATDLIPLVQGCVGAGVGTEYLAFVADADLPDPEALLADPSLFKPEPSRLDRTIVALSAVVAAVERDFTDARWKTAWSFVSVCAAPDAPDVGPAIIAGELLCQAYKRLGQKDAKAAAKVTNPAKLMPPRVALVLVPPTGGAK